MEVEVEVEVDPSLSEIFSPSTPPSPSTVTAEPLLEPASTISSSSLGGGAGNSGSSSDDPWPPPAIPLTEVFLLPGSPLVVVVVVVVAEEMVYELLLSMWTVTSLKAMSSELALRGRQALSAAARRAPGSISSPFPSPPSDKLQPRRASSMDWANECSWEEEEERGVKYKELSLHVEIRRLVRCF